MISFLGKVAQHIHENYVNSTENLCVVLPSKRAGLFLKKEIAKSFEKTIWSPIILSQDDFIQEICSAKIISSFELTLHFYSVYKNLPAEEDIKILERRVKKDEKQIADSSKHKKSIK